MSSIYRKGRDGYYYYQAYLYNPESKRKDKRVFKSLSTKDLIEAKKKKIKLDLKYETPLVISPFNKGLRLKYFRNIFFGFLSLCFILFIIKIKINKQEITKPIVNKKVIIAEPLIKKIEKGPDNNRNTVEILLTDNLLNEKKNVKGFIPEYYIERIDTLSGLFDQGKIYVVIKKKISNDIQLELCKVIAKKYIEFSNIIICLYMNDKPDKNLVVESENYSNTRSKKENWVALYTYNSVEGEYFDGNPTEYLGDN